jgi:hypothetical protein
MAGDITRITLNVYNLANSEYIDSLTDAELGQWMRLFMKSVLIAKECTLSTDEKVLSGYTKSRKVSPRILESFPVVNTEHGMRRRNNTLYVAWCEVRTRSVDASTSRSHGVARPVEPKPFESSNAADERQTNDKLTSDERLTNITVQNSTEHNTTEHDKTEGAGDVLSSMEKQHIDEANLGALKKGDPGYFKRGQYPGTKPKVIFSYISKVWERFKGEAAFARYPSKYPETWELLCGSKSGDLIVPAFELWCEAEGKNIATQWPTTDFVRDAEKYMDKIIPLNLTKPKVTPEQVEEITRNYVEQHKKIWVINPAVDVPVAANDPDEDPTALNELLGE